MAREIVKEEVAEDRGMNPFAMTVYVLTGLVELALSLRFIFLLLGANGANGFVSWVYDTTYELVQPFFGIFNYTPAADVASGRWEWSTLIAMIVWGFVGYGLASILSAFRRR